MKVLGILGSPRTNGITARLLDKTLKEYATKNSKVEKIILSVFKIAPCRECIGCKATGDCVVDDDMKEIYRKINSTDIIILASPIFFMSLPAHVKAMIDRCQSMWVRKYLLKKKNKRKKGIFIAVAGTKRKNVFDGAKTIVKAFFATINAEYSREIFVSGTDE
jgi:multimeric flavodoxin WrbA